MLLKAFGNPGIPMPLLKGFLVQPVSRGLLTKTVRIMKFMAVWMLIFCLHVSAKSRSQELSFSGTNVTLEKAFREIEKQTGYVVFSSKELLRTAKPVTISVQKVSLEKFLGMILKDQSLDFTVEAQTIFIRRKLPATIPSPIPLPITIQGVVTDSTGTGLAGASIRLKGSNKSVVSDNAGRFSIDAKEGDVLIVSYISYRTKEVKATGGQPMAIFLQLENSSMAEVSINVNTGYQSISRERAPGAFSVISAKKFENKIRGDLRLALEGQATGLVLTREGNTEVRGVSTINATSAPLIIVDGYPISGGLETINIDNVESVTVLKDAVAASIYGARSSNGVIVVTTKQGRKGVATFEYRGSTGMMFKPELSYLRRASTAQFIEGETDLFNQNPNSRLSSYNNYGYTSQVNYLLLAKMQGWLPAAEADKQIDALKQVDGLGQVEDHVFRNQLTQQHNLSVSAGGDKSTVSAAVRFTDNRGNAIHTGDQRLILDIRNDWKPNKRITVKLLSNVNYNTTKAPVRSLTDLTNYYSNNYIQPYSQLVDPATGKTRDIFAVNPRKIDRYAGIAGLKSMNYNPIDDLGLELTKTQNLQLRVGGSINVAITDGLNIEAGGSWTRGNLFSRSLYSKNSFRMRLGYNDNTSVSNPAKHYLPDGDMVVESRNINTAYTLRAQINYSKTFGRHSVTAIGGAELNRDVFDNNSYPTRFGYNDQAGTFSTFNYADYNAGLYNADMLGTTKPQNPVSLGTFSFRDNRFASWYANGLYEFDRRFNASGSIRLDQTNFFGTDPKYRYKPLWSAGGTYKLSNESFFASKIINKLYLRGSYGINGNISLNTGPFLIITAGSFSNLTGDVSYSISSPPNNALRWEKTATTNFGTDISLWNSRLNVTFDYYLRKSMDLLASDAVDPTIGYSTLTKNVGQINNTGIELTLEGDVLRSNRFVWNAFGTVSYNKNRVVEYNVNYTSASAVTTTSITREQYPVNAVFSYRYAGLDANGNPLYYGKDGARVGGGSVKVDEVEYSGTFRPKFVYSFTNRFRYGNVELSFMLMAKTGSIIRRVGYDGSNINQQEVAQRWRNAGDENKGVIYPKLSASSTTPFYFPYSNLFVESGNFIKCRDASLTYHVDKRLFRKLGMTAASVTVQGRNLFMIAANSKHLDPEAWELGASGTNAQQAELGFTYLPPRPEIYLGLKVNF